ncbi:hypothetical protein O9992_27820 [Vibrio lentus]|nr:hypothetical protein [Vibrio lentus]
MPQMSLLAVSTLMTVSLLHRLRITNGHIKLNLAIKFSFGAKLQVPSQFTEKIPSGPL